MMDIDFSAWFTGKSLSTDWASKSFPVWASLLAARRNEALDVLEIGSWEGRSAIFFLRYLTRCCITCVDTFAGGPEYAFVPEWANALPFIEDRFDSNLAEFGERVEKIKAMSCRGLARLMTEGRCFDLVYIDGSHHSADVQSDAMLSWPMVRDRGIVIFDDYEWEFLPHKTDRPKLGVDTFLMVHAGRYRELHRGYQLIIEKTGPSERAS